MSRRISVHDAVAAWIVAAAERHGRTPGQVVAALVAAFPHADLTEAQRAQYRELARPKRRP